MASPPFVVSTSTPGDSDIVSQYPINERGTRDILQSWLTANHDTNGNHRVAIFPWQGSTPATPSASLTTLYADAVGRLKIVYPDATVASVGIPAGTVLHIAQSAVPVGYLVADGSAVSRSTYADLFTALGTLYGVGDGSTTFNLPDLRGRVVAGEDSSAGRLTSSFFGTTAILGAVGGLESNTLTTAQLPSHNHANTLTDNGHSHTLATYNGSGTPLTGVGNSGTFGTQTTSSNVTGIVINNQFTGGGTGHNNTQPTIILKAIIKT